MNWIYLDNNATTQPLPEVVDAVTEAARDFYANPSSVHKFGQYVRHQVERAREQVAALIDARSKDIVFTGSGTESIDLAIRGALGARRFRKRIVTTRVEHSAVLQLVEQFAGQGYEVVYVDVDRQGQIDAAAFDQAVDAKTALVSLIHVNNETGVMADIEPLAAMAAERGAVVHVDAIQSAGKVPLTVTDSSVHLLSMAAHKFHGPKGVGALYIRPRTRLQPQMLGGGQEAGRRSGTEAVPAIIGMGVAAEIMRCDHATTAERVGGLRDELERGITKAVPIAEVIAADVPRVYNTSNMAFRGLSAEGLLILLSEAGVCVSSGSACASGSLEPSHVLLAMGLEEAMTHGSVRFSLSRFTTAAEIARTIELVPQVVDRVKL